MRGILSGGTLVFFLDLRPHLTRGWRKVGNMREALPAALNKSVAWKIKILKQHISKKKDRLQILGQSKAWSKEINEQIH